LREADLVVSMDEAPSVHAAASALDVCDTPPGGTSPHGGRTLRVTLAFADVVAVEVDGTMTPHWAFTRYDHRTDRSVRLVCPTGRSDDRIV